MLTSDQWHQKALETKLDQRSIELRFLVLRALQSGGRGHVGSALSLIEIFRVLYDDVMQFNPMDPAWILRDRCLLSKGHGCLALYAILADKGFFPREVLDTFCEFDSILGGHPEPKVPGVEIAAGSLGHGLAIGVGMAIAARIQNRKNKVYVVVGDGEINEGSIWESALSAAKHKLSNLNVMIDYNKMQSYGSTKEVLDMEPLVQKWQSFGFQVHEVNGHDITALKTTLSSLLDDNHKPHAIICHTIKGKGLKLAENNPAWHHKSKLIEEEMNSIYQALQLEIDQCVLKV